MSDRFEALLADYFEGDLDAAGFAELEALLDAHPDLADRAVDLYVTHRGLGLVHQAKDPELFAQATIDRLRADREGFVGSLKERLRGSAAPASRRPWPAYALVAAATLVFSLTLQVLLRRPADPAAPSGGPVATLVRSDKARWEPEGAILEGQRLVPGPLRLSRGSAILLFDSGALVALHGPADLQIESRGAAFLRHGRLLVRAEQDAAGFSVRTPAGEAVDLGTEFAVSVDLAGSTELHVQQGEVSWSRTPGHPPSHVLKSGQAMRFDGPRGDEGRSITFLAQSLDDFLRQLSFEIQPTRPTAREDFEYDSGENPPDRASGGDGWAGPWRFRRGVEVTREPDRPDQMKLLPDGLRGSWSPLPEPGGALALPPGNSVLLRELAEPIDLGRDAVYYISFAARREADAPPGSSEVPHFRFTLRSSRDYWGPSISAGLPLSRRPTLQFQSRDNFVAQTEVEIGAATFWVLKIVAGRSRPDEVFLKVFRSAEAMPRFEPAPWSAVTGPLPGAGRLDLVVVTGTGPATHVFDGLRVGRTWDSVVRRD